jgi:hypothetical protein
VGDNNIIESLKVACLMYVVVLVTIPLLIYVMHEMNFRWASQSLCEILLT